MIQKARQELTKEDMEQIGRQKRESIRAAVRARALWNWECSLIFPIFNEHPDWIYQQCYDAVCTNNGGHFPDPPTKLVDQELVELGFCSFRCVAEALESQETSPAAASQEPFAATPIDYTPRKGNPT